MARTTRSAGGIGVQLEGVDETLAALDDVEHDLARGKRLAGARADVARALAGALAQAASSSGVPVAPRVASSISVKPDGVAIGGSAMVGTGKRGYAAVLVWGSEQGPKSDPNRFAVAPNSSGYWIAPTAKRFRERDALATYRRAVDGVVRDAGLAA